MLKRVSECRPISAPVVERVAYARYTRCMIYILDGIDIVLDVICWISFYRRYRYTNRCLLGELIYLSKVQDVDVVK